MYRENPLYGSMEEVTIIATGYLTISMHVKSWIGRSRQTGLVFFLPMCMGQCQYTHVCHHANSMQIFYSTYVNYSPLTQLCPEL